MRPAAEEGVCGVERVRVGEGDGRDEAVTRCRHWPDRQRVGGRGFVAPDDRSAARAGDDMIDIVGVHRNGAHLSGELTGGAGRLPRWLPPELDLPETATTGPEAREQAVIEDVGSDEGEIVKVSVGENRKIATVIARARDVAVLMLGANGVWMVGIDRHVATVAGMDRQPAIRSRRGGATWRAVVLGTAEPRAAIGGCGAAGGPPGPQDRGLRSAAYPRRRMDAGARLRST